MACPVAERVRALKSGGTAIGWVVHPQTSMANETFTISGLPEGYYEVQIFRTWRGSYLKPHTAESRDGKLTVTIPELRTSRGHASHIGRDVAFKIKLKGSDSGASERPPGSTRRRESLRN